MNMMKNIDSYATGINFVKAVYFLKFQHSLHLRIVIEEMHVQNY